MRYISYIRGFMAPAGGSKLGPSVLNGAGCPFIYPFIRRNAIRPSVHVASQRTRDRLIAPYYPASKLSSSGTQVH